ncbi:MAG: family N-acetyltransferase [Actinomycetota bacterium]|nr:family N-acetyltransferase [Actinomycetota bacterium]
MASTLPAPLPDPLTLREVDPDDPAALDAFMAQVSLVFSNPVRHTAERRDFRRSAGVDHRLLGTFDGERIVGTYRSWETRVTLPGGALLPANAVSSVTVRPTHRRRGILSAMITKDLTDAAARGLPAAVLIAAESVIYGRFGFGPATETATWHLDVRRTVPRPRAGAGGRTEVVDPSEVRHLAPAVFEAARLPGAMDREPWWWDVTCEITRWPGDPVVPQACVLHREDDGTPSGYAFYTWKENGHGVDAMATIVVGDLQAATGGARTALWSFFASLDLVATVRAEDRPVDDPLPGLLVDARAARRTASADFLWIRLLDPAAALAARTYECPGRVSLRVTDPLGHATGTYVLDVAGDGTATVTRTDDDADLTLPVDVLSSVYLGAGDLYAAGLAGRVDEHSPGAAARLARILRTTRAPWTGTWF